MSPEQVTVPPDSDFNNQTFQQSLHVVFTDLSSVQSGFFNVKNEISIHWNQNLISTKLTN